MIHFQPITQTRTRTHAGVHVHVHRHAQTHARTHTHTHTQHNKIIHTLRYQIEEGLFFNFGNNTSTQGERQQHNFKKPKIFTCILK